MSEYDRLKAQKERIEQKRLTDKDVRAVVDSMLTTRTQKQLADELGVSSAYLNDYLHFRREPGEKLLVGLGLRRVVMYERDPREVADVTCKEFECPYFGKTKASDCLCVREHCMNMAVKADRGLDNCSIEFVRQIEKDIDAAMLSNGFARTTTTKAGDSLEFNYRQFGVCLGRTRP